MMARVPRVGGQVKEWFKRRQKDQWQLHEELYGMESTDPWQRSEPRLLGCCMESGQSEHREARWDTAIIEGKDPGNSSESRYQRETV